MRNHDDKTRDMARSVLPSTARATARWRRAQAHRHERAHVHRLLGELRRFPHPDDFDGDLRFEARRELCWMVSDRRASDKVAPLVRWAERTIERDPVLAAAPPEGREAHFRAMLPPGLIGTHALAHLSWAFGDRPRWWWAAATRSQPATLSDIELVEDIIAAGLHGELNRRIRSRIAPVVAHTTHLRAERLVDGDHAAPGLLLPERTVVEHRRRHIRFLAGAHDAGAFARDADLDVLEVVRALHAEANRPQPAASGRV